MQTFHEDESSEGSGNDKVFPHDHIVAVIGEQNTQYYPTLIHLVMADSAYSKGNGVCVCVCVCVCLRMCFMSLKKGHFVFF